MLRIKRCKEGDVQVMPARKTATPGNSYGRVQIMSEARWGGDGERFEQSLEAIYGIKHCDERGYVYDIEPFGLFLSGERFYLPGTKLKVKIEFDTVHEWSLRGTFAGGRLNNDWIGSTGKPEWESRSFILLKVNPFT